jgi:hypothetical protein
MMLSAGASPKDAHAEVGEWAVGVGGAWRLVPGDDGNTNGLGVSFGAHFTIDDFWQLGASGELLATLPDGRMLGGARVDVRWLFDVLTWVPFIEVSAGIQGGPAADGAWDVNGIVLGSLGLDYRPERDWSFGIRGGAGLLVAADGSTASITRVDLQAIFHFD